jgi:septal ring factor EnvC (AmiA/AmiB activator)
LGGAAGLLLVAAIALLVVRSRLKADLAAMARLAEMEKAALEEKWHRPEQLETVRADLASVEAQLDQRRDAMAELEAQKAALAQTSPGFPCWRKRWKSGGTGRNSSMP